MCVCVFFWTGLLSSDARRRFGSLVRDVGKFANNKEYRGPRLLNIGDSSDYSVTGAAERISALPGTAAATTTAAAAVVNTTTTTTFVRLSHWSLFLGPFAKLSVCPSTNRRIFMKFDIWIFCEYLSRKLKFHQNLARITGTLYEDICTFMIMSRWALDKSCWKNQNTRFVFNNLFLPKIVPFMRQCGKIW